MYLTAGLAILGGLGLLLAVPRPQLFVCVYGFALLLVHLVAPGMFLYFQRNKQLIRGPWDIAELRGTMMSNQTGGGDPPSPE